MKLFFYDNYQDDGCSFCGDDGERYGLVATLQYRSVMLSSGSVSVEQLKTMIENEEFDKEELEHFMKIYPNAKIDII